MRSEGVNLVPEVSLVIPVYNSEAFLCQCLESVLAQTFEDMEIVCVDDGSTDSSPEILAEFAERDDRIRVLTQPNAGVAAARSRGLQLAVGDFVLFLDNDDFFEPDMVEEAYRACVADDADLAVFKIRCVDAKTGEIVDARWSLRTDLIPAARPFNRLDMPQTLFLAFTPTIWNKLFRRSFLAENGIRLRTDLKYTDDLAFTYTALALAERITIVDKVLLSYRTRRDGSLWTRASDHPGDVCASLLEVKHQLNKAGVLEDVEPAFLNAALLQSVWVLSNLRTLEGFIELYSILKTSCFAELGIDRLSADTCLRPSEYERYLRIMRVSPEQYLFDEVMLGGTEMTRLRDEAAALRAELRRRSAQLSDANSQAQHDQPVPRVSSGAFPDESGARPQAAIQTRRQGRRLRAPRGSYFTPTVTSKVSAGAAVGSNERQYFSLSVPVPARLAHERPDLGAARAQRALTPRCTRARPTCSSCGGSSPSIAHV